MSPFEYTTALRQVILDFKFRNCYSYASLLAEIMNEYILSYDIWKEFDYIVPVPLHKGRLKERGYNQSELISQYISDFLNIPMRNDILHRIRATKRQSSLQKRERINNVRGAFRCNTDLSGKQILLFDDICTTRNTLEACAVALADSNASNICALTLSIQIEDELPLMTY